MYLFDFVLYCFCLKLIQVLTYATLWISPSSSTIIKAFGVDDFYGDSIFNLRTIAMAC
jgi:hypothetical protein